MSEENKENIYGENLPDEGSSDAGYVKVHGASLVITVVAIVLVAVMLTVTLCNSFYRKRIAEIRLENVSVGSGEFDSLALIDALFEKYSYYGVDSSALIDSVIKAYVEATGDVYAEYYNADEYEAILDDMAGDYVGMGVTVENSTVNIEGSESKVLEIVLVTTGGPADRAGLKTGDMIYSVTLPDRVATVDEIGFDDALKALKGDAGNVVDFTIVRAENGVLQNLPYSVTFEKVASQSVVARKSEADPNVAIVSIYRFDLQTPAQFKKVMDELTGSGCSKVVFDLRENLGGDLDSIVAVLSTLLNKSDVIITIEGKDGEKETMTASPVAHDGRYAECTVDESDIGRYRDKLDDIAVICNGNTASAAELFCAVLRDYSLAELVGTKTFGKGSVQRTISLEKYGMGGALKLTTSHYFPPCGVGYHGIGIEPDVTVELADEAKGFSIYKIPQDLDNQLAAALQTLN